MANSSVLRLPKSSKRAREDRLLGAVVAGNDCWAMDPHAFESLLSAVSDFHARVMASKDGAFFMFDDEDEPKPEALDVRRGAAVIPIMGPLTRGTSFTSFFSGRVTGYDSIAALVNEAAERHDVKSIVLRMDTPGGLVGVSPVTTALREASARKPIHAYVDGMAASAGYWIASNADHVWSASDGAVGSIGVVTTMVDYAEADAKRGIKFLQLVSSNAPNKRTHPIDSSVTAQVQSRLDAYENIFVSDVARGRGVTRDRVVKDFGRGGVVLAPDAMFAGMIDGVRSFSQVLSMAQNFEGGARA